MFRNDAIQLLARCTYNGRYRRNEYGPEGHTLYFGNKRTSFCFYNKIREILERRYRQRSMTAQEKNAIEKYASLENILRVEGRYKRRYLIDKLHHKLGTTNVCFKHLMSHFHSFKQLLENQINTLDLLNPHILPVTNLNSLLVKGVIDQNDFYYLSTLLNSPEGAAYANLSYYKRKKYEVVLKNCIRDVRFEEVISKLKGCHNEQ